jgi:hypothetical protein
VAGFDLRPLSAKPWRAVEAQHVNSTRKLVDSDAEQESLEALIDGVKPPPPEGPEFVGLHYLLSTPFRYPPLPHGSRFGVRAERGIYYGSETRRAMFAEVAYYRLLFLEGTAADIPRIQIELTVFRVPVRTRRGVDLTRGPFLGRAGRISSPVSYAFSQRLGARMRASGVEAFRYRSARDREGGANVGLFTPRVFASKRPSGFETWRCVAAPRLVEFSQRDFRHKAAFSFPREEFEVDGRLPSPAF